MKIKFKTKFLSETDYPKENRKYYSSSGPKKRLTDLLLLKCRGYCMYCGKKIVLENDYRFQIEHAVDKDGNVHQEVDKHGVLEHCKYNLALSCSECNQVCKKAVDKVDLKKYEPLNKCPSKCSKTCENYDNIRKEYEKKNAIILQPIGINQSGGEVIIYNLLDHLYEPSEDITDDNTIFLIQNHIDRFKLNGTRFSTAIITICGRVVYLIDSGIQDISSIYMILDEENNENIIGEDFIRLLRTYFKDSSCKRLRDFCQLLVILDVVVYSGIE